MSQYVHVCLKSSQRTAIPPLKSLNQEPIPAIDPLAETTTSEKTNSKALPPKTKASTNSKNKSGLSIPPKFSSNQASTSIKRTASSESNTQTQPGTIHVRGPSYRNDSDRSFLRSRRNANGVVATNDENNNNESDATITSANWLKSSLQRISLIFL
mmetsp:Transcript_18029/g.20798  ORF Transcript_18029/g.20798 Transcript_18029/m.20798 type:complete len:156 (+) Transcript_18029:58-525(+)